ncbi:MAG: PGF-pre-PGF domain-containing protein, partial [Candidatus Methanoperedens sp.]|nr:PGF-pre-PGF domain-containing protein [Candidatus Methanoperedens sp.]
FRVQNSWLETNGPVNIKLVKWNASEWLQLETVEIARDSLYKYYEARTNAFSPFAKTAFKAETGSTVTQKPSTPAETPTPKTPASVVKEKSWGLKEILTITAAILAMITAMISVAYFKEKKKK